MEHASTWTRISLELIPTGQIIGTGSVNGLILKGDKTLPGQIMTLFRDAYIYGLVQNCGISIEKNTGYSAVLH